ncbi:TetR/AcrR family transcriptional regulator [Paraburkholderia xenovorans]|jgi:AcrR family transcriptional regulator
MPTSTKSSAAPKKVSRSKPAKPAPKAKAEVTAPESRARSIRNEVGAYKRELILRAACETFFEHGYHDTTVDMIADRLSGSKAIFYYNYADKHAVLEAICKRALGTAQEVVQRAIDSDAAPASMLRTFARHYAEWVIDNQLMVGVFWREERSLSDAARAALAVELKKFDDMVAQIIDRGVASGDFKVDDVHTTSRAISGMISFTYTWWRAGRRLSREDAADYYAMMALRLVGAPL